MLSGVCVAAILNLKYAVGRCDFWNTRKLENSVNIYSFSQEINFYLSPISSKNSLWQHMKISAMYWCSKIFTRKCFCIRNWPVKLSFLSLILFLHVLFLPILWIFFPLFPSGQVPSFCRHVPEGDDQSGCMQIDHGGFCKVGVLS